MFKGVVLIAMKKIWQPPPMKASDVTAKEILKNSVVAVILSVISNTSMESSILCNK